MSEACSDNPTYPFMDAHHRFFQLSGHKESFKLGPRPNTILKRLSSNEEKCLAKLMHDPLASFVPKLYGSVVQDDELYIEMEDLLAKFSHNQNEKNGNDDQMMMTTKDLSVMDVKMGIRTYCEEELGRALTETKLRGDMYDKMVEVDENEPNEEERELKAITKPRYMIWRETISSTSTLGFRIEAMRLKDGSIDNNFKTTKSEEQISKAFLRYTGSKKIRLAYLNRLYELRQALLESKFFQHHELIGTSLLFVHSEQLGRACVWLIDFAKTSPLPQQIRTTHYKKWELGNHEDGYLVGISNLIRIFESITFVCHQLN